MLRQREETYYFGTYSEAEKFYNQQSYEKAIAAYQAYIDENPEGNLAVIARYYIGKSHLALGHNAEAKAAFEEIVQKHPDSTWGNFAQTQLKDMGATPTPVATPAPSESDLDNNEKK